MKIFSAKLKKIWKLSFFEESIELKKIINSFPKWTIVKVLDLWCWNWRMKLLFNSIANIHYTWVDNEEFKIQYSDIFIKSDINDFLWKCKESFDIIILNWMFENNLKFSKAIMKKIIKLLSSKWFVYINLWNYWKNQEYRSENINDLTTYIVKYLIPILESLKISFNIKLYNKIKNVWFNINITCKKI